MTDNKKNEAIDDDVIDIEVQVSPATGAKEPQDNNLKQRRSGKRGRKMRYAGHGVLSEHPERALAKAGEDLKKLQRTKRELYRELQPDGALGKILFDRLWFCYLKMLLIARMENKVVPRKTKA
jgi:hypothetical protein